MKLGKNQCEFNECKLGMKSANKILIMTGLIIGVIFSELDENGRHNCAAHHHPRSWRNVTVWMGRRSVYVAMTSFIPILGKLADLCINRVHHPFWEVALFYFS
ncbi:hypothetical protein PASE110613_13740 [Paenibacillus sediminis]|uniref:Uncharacterized protein n=1 Tax=Paenibacillus sediminis TaxID=664909 RepID=A0ABS4H402_9BACL|nr:hypothetical protein [Paenibacillus sediminis]MBP1937238.1 hypothetical protein [Paenibacillus sediminis]